jgi:hypothetical protein
MASALVFGSASMHSLFQFHHPKLAQAALAIQAGERILLKPWACIVHALISLNRLDNATHQLASSIQHWNVHTGSAGLEASLLRSRRLPGGFSTHNSSQPYEGSNNDSNSKAMAVYLLTSAMLSHLPRCLDLLR